jgi:hypothetical protein
VRIAVSERLGDNDSIGGFLAAMIWGYGTVGYGPFRTQRVLSSETYASTLLKGAIDHNSLVSYERLATSMRLRWLNPAFGTKWLYFASGTRSLILDRVVTNWPSENANWEVDLVHWSLVQHAAYLERTSCCVTTLEIEPDELEQPIFTDQSDSQRSQWRRERLPYRPSPCADHRDGRIRIDRIATIGMDLEVQVGW